MLMTPVQPRQQEGDARAGIIARKQRTMMRTETVSFSLVLFTRDAKKNADLQEAGVLLVVML